MITPLPGATPMVPGSCTLPFPGIQAAIVDETGKDVPNGQAGILVLKKPWHSMIRTIWGDPERFKKSYYPDDFQGKYYLIYFGFTYCPDVCPISLMKMASALNKVRASKEYAYFDLEPIFVSVDPNRDSNTRIEEYVKIFHPDLIGLTQKENSSPELKQMLKKFKIHVSKIFLTEDDEREDLKSLKENAPEVAEKMLEVSAKEPKKEIDEKYTLDHTIVVYLMGPDNEFLTYLGSNLDDNAMTEIILDEVSADLKRRVYSAKKQ
jgi:cytochrome oxidase Cu insertion factor (SCO1/SenC/PrrC family)